MTDSLYDTQAYNYPMLDDDTRIKIAKLRQSIARLEANLLTPDSVAKDASTDRNFDNNPILEQSSVDYAGELKQSQLLAATAIKGKVLVIAGAGSGKTKTLTYRTSYLIESGASPSSILPLTFTRKAADEIKGRVKELLAEKVADNSASTNLRGLNLNTITSGTFHSFCNMLLRRYSCLLGINPRYTILDTSDSEDAIDLTYRA